VPAVNAAPIRTRRDEAADDTKRRLTAAAVALVEKIGWRAATVERIAADAGVAKGTFFVHFPNKEALVETLVGLQTRAARRAREEEPTRKSPIARLRATVLTLGRQAGTSIELSRAVLVATMQSPDIAQSVDAMFGELYDAMLADAREAIHAGLIRGIDADGLTNMLMASYLGAALHCTTSRRAKPLEEVLAPLVDATLSAFSVTKKKRRKSK